MNGQAPLEAQAMSAAEHAATPTPWHASAPGPWEVGRCWAALLCRRLVEISGAEANARLSLAVFFVLAAQRAGETVAWVQRHDGSLYPPDLHASGVDLRALVVIHVGLQGRFGPLRAVEILLRSGGFGMVVLDASAGESLPDEVAWQSRLLALCRLHHSSMVILPPKTDAQRSLGPLVGLRVMPRRQRLAPSCRLGQAFRPLAVGERGIEAFGLSVEVLKNKGGACVPPAHWHCWGPAGL